MFLFFPPPWIRFIFFKEWKRAHFKRCSSDPSHGRVESLPSISGYLLWRVLKTGFGWQGPSLSYSMAVAYLLFYVVCLYMCGGWSASAFQHASDFLIPIASAPRMRRIHPQSEACSRMRSPSIPAAAAQAPWDRVPLRRRVRGGRVTSPAGDLKSAARLCSLGFPSGEQLSVWVFPFWLPGQ